MGLQLYSGKCYLVKKRNVSVNITENVLWITTMGADYDRVPNTLSLDESAAHQNVLRFREDEKPNNVTAENIPDDNRTWPYQPRKKGKFYPLTSCIFIHLSKL